MKSKNRKVKLICTILALMLCLQFASCGFLLYPERRGQTHGRIDPAIAVLDGVGLLLFLVPGIIVFAVDFATGTIYLPSSKRAATPSSTSDDMVVIHIDPDELTTKKIASIVSDHTGNPFSFDQNNLRAYELERTKNIEAEVIKLARFWKHVPQRAMVAHHKNS